MTTYGMFPSAAAKSGLVGMTRSLALDFWPRADPGQRHLPRLDAHQLVDEWLQLQPEGAAAERRVPRPASVRRMATPAEIANFVSLCGI